MYIVYFKPLNYKWRSFLELFNALTCYLISITNMTFTELNEHPMIQHYIGTYFVIGVLITVAVINISYICY